MPSSLDLGFGLDRQWHWLRGEMETSKRPTLLSLARLLDRAGVPYVVIGGIALQVRQDEPRTTLDIDLAVRSRHEIPRHELQTQGFEWTGSFEHSDNWRGPDGTPIQFTDDPAFGPAIADADRVDIGEITLPVLRASELLHAKLRAVADPQRRRSKRLQDLADAQALLEREPDLAQHLSAQEQTLFARLPD